MTLVVKFRCVRCDAITYHDGPIAAARADWKDSGGIIVYRVISKRRVVNEAVCGGCDKREVLVEDSDSPAKYIICNKCELRIYKGPMFNGTCNSCIQGTR